jgi:hypothetical protein
VSARHLPHSHNARTRVPNKLQIEISFLGHLVRPDTFSGGCNPRLLILNPIRGLVCYGYAALRINVGAEVIVASSPTMNRQSRESPERVHTAEYRGVVAAPYLG